MDSILGDFIESVDLAGSYETWDTKEAELYLESYGQLADAIAGEDAIVIREDSNSTEAVAAVYLRDDLAVEGSREDTVATIAIEAPGSDPIVLTWRQARALAVALGRIEGIGRNG